MFIFWGDVTKMIIPWLFLSNTRICLSSEYTGWSVVTPACAQVLVQYDRWGGGESFCVLKALQQTGTTGA